MQLVRRAGACAVIGAHADASWRLVVAQEKGEHIVRAVVAGLGDKGEVWRVGSAIGVSSSLLIGVGAGQGVTQLAGSGKHLTLVIGAVLDLNLDRQGHFVRHAAATYCRLLMDNPPLIREHTLVQRGWDAASGL